MLFYISLILEDFILQRLSITLSDSMKKYGFIDSKEVDIYEYCFDYIISNILYDIVIMILGLLLHQPGITIIYLISFNSLRRYAGGYHAPGRRSCSIMSYLLYLLILSGTVFIHVYRPYIWLASFLLALGVIVILAPISTPNKPITDSRKRKMKQKTFISSILLFIAFIIFYVLKASNYYVTLELCVIIILIMQVAQLIINKRKE